MISNLLTRINFLTLALAVFAIAQVAPTKHTPDSLNVIKELKNYNDVQLDKWGPITYSGVGKCDILDLYQKNTSQNLGFSTIVDYHYKQTKINKKYHCKSWGLGLSFKINSNSQSHSIEDKEDEISHNIPSKEEKFSATQIDAIQKSFTSKAAYLGVESITPITFKLKDDCNVVDFLFEKANEKSGFHGIIDIKYAESEENYETVCSFWGLAVKYKQRTVVEKNVVKKRPPQKIAPPVLNITPEIKSAPAKKTKNNCGCCCCCN